MPGRDGVHEGQEGTSRKANTALTNNTDFAKNMKVSLYWKLKSSMKWSDTLLQAVNVLLPYKLFRTPQPSINAQEI